MRFEQALLEGTLLRRNRFQADVRLKSGEEVTVHCANNGALVGCSDPGAKVYLSPLANPRLKFNHQLEVIYAGRTPVAVHSGRPNTVVSEAIMAGKVAELYGYAQLRRPTRDEKGPRVDMVLTGNGLRTCHLIVRNVTCAHEGVAYYPDLPSPVETEQLTDLVDLVRAGHRAMVFFVAQRNDVHWFRPADHLDPQYAQAFRDAAARGVEVLAFRADVSRRGIELDQRLEIDLADPNARRSS